MRPAGALATERRARQATGPDRSSVSVLLAVATLLLPMLASLGHAEHADGPFDVVHTEASHPRAAPHLEPEEHPEHDGCLVCVHVGKSYVGPAVSSPAPIVSELRAVRPIVLCLAQTGRASASPRAPPR
jgi:hypothetical protein